ncbi:hypothetical protein O181_049713 [Austropuccinia psidii MF-1]|uniref:Uncharacterized protein n=1 Tax=Austropuccinia psidii MF-1 TaxID=1389203 RepID=A0A9Q3E0E6_9BASI|nr:hypothetical protein [Austropuccinia psidii MF-1]
MPDGELGSPDPRRITPDHAGSSAFPQWLAFMAVAVILKARPSLTRDRNFHPQLQPHLLPISIRLGRDPQLVDLGRSEILKFFGSIRHSFKIRAKVHRISQFH